MGGGPCILRANLGPLPVFVSQVGGPFLTRKSLTAYEGSRVAVICTNLAGNGDRGRAHIMLDGPGPVHSAEPRQDTVFWDSGPLPMGPHTLIIVNAGNHAFRLDRIDYDPTDGNAPNRPSEQKSGLRLPC